MDRLYRLLKHGETFYAVERHGTWYRAVGDLEAGFSPGEPLDGGLGTATVLAPSAPSKLVCVGLNYRDHAAEMKKALPPEPLLFLKTPNTIINPGNPILLPPRAGRIEHEAELAVVIGRRAHRVSRAKAFDHVLGVTGLNDVTAREIQSREVQYTRAKGFDTFAPFGPCVLLGAKGEPRAVQGSVNGQLRQSSTTEQLIFPLDMLIEYITFVMTLEPGDVISTGTPSGVGALKAGDVVTVSVEGVGELTNPVEDEP